MLNQDFQALEHGDETIVGDGGSGLSGGQRTRVDYARTLYQQGDILLLDDPLSALDGNVARDLLRGLKEDKELAKTLRILVTNKLQYLKEADYIVVMHEVLEFLKLSNFWKKRL